MKYEVRMIAATDSDYKPVTVLFETDDYHAACEKFGNVVATAIRVQSVSIFQLIDRAFHNILFVRGSFLFDSRPIIMQERPGDLADTYGHGMSIVQPERTQLITEIIGAFSSYSMKVEPLQLEWLYLDYLPKRFPQ